jgi:hypothetical protein
MFTFDIIGFSGYDRMRRFLTVSFAGMVLCGVASSLVARAQTKPTAPPQPKAASKSTSLDLPDGALDLSDLWPSLLQPAVETDTIALEPALSVTGGNGGAGAPSFTGDPDFDGDSFEVNGQDDIVIPYFQMADQMRLDFEDGHQLQGPPEQPTQVAIRQRASPRSAAGAVVVASRGASSLAHKTSVIAQRATAVIGLKAAVAATPKTPSARFHGTAFWSGGNSIFDASPFALTGDSAANPDYSSNNFGITMGVAPFIPGHTKPSLRDFILVSYSGQSSSSVVNNYGLVPTDLERQGNFSQLTGPDGTVIPIYPPKSITPYPNNIINSPLDPAAVALLRYLPSPNLQSTGLNYRLLTTKGTHANTLAASYTHNFGPVTAAGQPDDSGPTKQINLGFNFGDVAADVVTLFPSLAGKQRVQGYSLNIGYTFGKRNWLANISIISNRNDAQVRNLFTGKEDVASSVGVYADDFKNPLNTDPLNFGLPNLIINNFSSFAETQPNFQLTQTTGISGSAAWVYGRHILRFGTDLHRIEFNLFGGTNATGTYVFTGGYTQIEGSSTTNPVSTTGSPFADFLIGLPQQTKIEAPYQKAYTRQTVWDGYVRDDWRILSNLTLLAGLRYDYYSPFVERHDRLSTLDYNADFSDIAPVQPGGVGSVSGATYSRSLINPDRSNFAPHIGLAWQARKNTVVRSAYSIYYTVAQYGTFIQKLAYQPPFAHVEVNGNVPHVFTFFTLQSGFGNSADDGNYAINRNYKLPYVQVWYVDVQQTLPLNLVLDVGYAGAKGTKLDVVSAPGQINALPFGSAFFDYEDSNAFSNFNSFVARIRHEMSKGLAFSTIYAYSHSIDDASSTNGGLPVVAQNPNYIRAEESNSSFDIRHQLTGSFLYQFPIGPGKAYLSRPSFTSRALGGISVAGYFSLATGVPLTPYVAASVAEVERGTHGSVRPNRVPGTSIRVGGGQRDHWFNTAAFSTQFAAGQLYGTASRYSIPGPGVENVNLSLSKNIRLGGTRNLVLRASANNALNIVQYSDLDTQIGSSTFGYVTGAQPMRQFTFLAKFSF